jgi:hypothetical protein
MVRKTLLVVLIISLLAVFACKKEEPPAPPMELVSFTADTLDLVLMADYVYSDEEIFAEGSGAIRLTTEMPMSVDIYAVDYPEVENRLLVYKAKIRSQELVGDASLAMKVTLTTGTAFDARQEPSTAVGGTTDWTECEASLLIPAGSEVKSVVLGFSVDGFGTAWIDDLRVISAPPPGSVVEDE